MIELKNISKSYDSKIIYERFNHCIHDHSFTLIYGKSGSGKTTLLNLLCFLEKPDRGEILLNKKLVKHREIPRLLRTTFSYSFQNYGLVDDDTVYENLLIPLKYSKLNKKAKKELIDKYLTFVGLNCSVKEKVYKLSGGEQQRVGVVKSLIKQTPYFLLDEPTGNLDDTNAEVIIHLLKEEHKNGKTVIVATHDERFRKIATDIINLDKL